MFSSIGSRFLRLGNAASNPLDPAELDNLFGAMPSLPGLFGTAGNDTVRGTAAAERVHGIGAVDLLLGRGTKDVLTGGAGDDLFVLGDDRGAFYDDGVASKSGRGDYASIRDFTAGDRVLLHGSAANYVLKAETLGRAGMGVYLDTNRSGSWDALDELVAHVAGSSVPQALDSASFVFTADFARPASVVIRAANAAELTAALCKVKGGETILLTGDDYGSFSLRRINPGSDVTIKSDEEGGRATFRTLNISDSSNLIFDSIDVQLTPLADTANEANLVRIYQSTNIDLTNSLLRGFDAITGVDPGADVLDASRNVIGLPVGRGLFVHNSNEVTISDNELTNLSVGLAFTDSRGLTVTDNQVHDLRRTGLQAGGVSDMEISGNSFSNHNPWNFGGAGDHGDYIHIWSRGTERAANANVSITGNLIAEGAGSSVLGIYIDDNRTGVGFENYTIADNVILLGEHQAIRVENMRGLIADNTLVQTSGTAKENPLIFAMDGSDVTVSNNIAGGFHAMSGSVMRQSGNLSLQGQKAGSTHYSSVMQFDASNGVDLSDVVLIAGTVAAQRGTGADLSLFGGWNGTDYSRLSIDHFVIA